jgi:hypothetical protein
VDPSQSIISLSSDNEPFSYEKMLQRLLSTPKPPLFQPKPVPQTNKPENPPEMLNNLYLTQKTSLHPIPRPQPSQILNSYLEKDRTSLLWNQTQKKGPSFVKGFEVPPDSPPSTPRVFNLGSFEKAPARATFKAARKGKKKMVSDISTFILDLTRKGGFEKPPQQQ